jgi:hypothetical protein
MKTARINVVDQTFGLSTAGGVVGQVFLEVGQKRFPGEKWSDFVVVLLTWWCRALTRCVHGDSGPIDVRFMEGPFLVQLSQVSRDVIHLELIEAGLKRRTILQDDVESQPLINSVLEASEQVLTRCQESSWWSPDADELSSASTGLRRSLLRSVN